MAQEGLRGSLTKSQICYMKEEVKLNIDQGVATLVLLLFVCSVEDQQHTPPALLVGLSVATITITMGANAGASMNPAADFMPR